jgi:hypothetical protein
MVPRLTICQVIDVFGDRQTVSTCVGPPSPRPDIAAREFPDLAQIDLLCTADDKYVDSLIVDVRK